MSKIDELVEALNGIRWNTYRVVRPQERTIRNAQLKNPEDMYVELCRRTINYGRIKGKDDINIGTECVFLPKCDKPDNPNSVLKEIRKDGLEKYTIKIFIHNGTEEKEMEIDGFTPYDNKIKLNEYDTKKEHYLTYDNFIKALNEYGH